MPMWPPVQIDVKTPTVFECVQGYVTLEDADNVNDGSLLVIDRGHFLHAPYFRTNEKRGNWHLLPAAFLKKVNPKRNPIIPVLAKKGSMVLWYSRTPHQGRPPTAAGRNRAVVYVCHAPKQLMTQKDLDARANAWKNGLMTSHWPVLDATCFPHKPLYPGRPSVELTDLGKSLLGLDTKPSIPQRIEKNISRKKRSLPKGLESEESYT